MLPTAYNWDKRRPVACGADARRTVAVGERAAPEVADAAPPFDRAESEVP